MGNGMDGCLVCESPIEYFENTKEVICVICGEEHASNALCSQGHFVCDACHRKKGFEDIKRIALSSGSVNPIEIADEMMRANSIHMHGPEHHFLVAAALLSAYFNQNMNNESDSVKNGIIEQAEQRAEMVPGGICGLWGSCGAAVGSGIFISIITGATPYTVDSWSKANLTVSEGLKIISENGGPRCCKRNTYLAITSTVGFLKANMDIHLEMPQSIICEHYERNNECKRKDCKYYDQKNHE